MIDIHCHLLPGIDDGANTLEQSLALAQCAVKDGITHMVFTPHIQPGVYDNDLNSISTAFHLLSDALQHNNIDLQVAMAAEVRLCPEILSLLESDQLPLLLGSNAKKTLLLELPHSHIPPGTEHMLSWLMRQGVDILIAHPERNKEVMLNVNKLLPLLDMGCLFQLTAGSVCGRFGEQSRAIAEYILQQGWATLLASDAHNLQRRPPQLSHGKHAASIIIGEKNAHKLVTSAPLTLVEGMFKCRRLA